VIVFRPDIPPHVAEAIRRLPPDLKRGIKAALRALSLDPHSGVPLARELDGFWKYRVKRYRIVYAIDRSQKIIRIVAVGHRRGIYEEVIEMTRHRAGT
jgi:mRNA interferase RelE/StbE